VSSPEPYSGERSRQYCFGDFTLDLESGFLRRGGEEVALRPKAFEVLAYLVQHHGRLATKAALNEAVWPDTFVMDNSLVQCLVEIRRALGDDSQQLIRTVARRGYLFTAAVTTPVVEFPRKPTGAEAEPGPLPVPPAPAPGGFLNRRSLTGALMALALAAIALLLVWLNRPARQELTSVQHPGFVTYEQITSFTDSAVSPALSPDGRMVAFLRSDAWFLSTDQIYVKMLPNGEPVQITHDPRPKYGLSSSPDGLRIVYTVWDRG